MDDNKQPDENILQVSPSELPVIKELKDFMQMMQLKNLQHLLEYTVSDLLKMEGFNYRCLKSLLAVLEENGYAYLLKDE